MAEKDNIDSDHGTPLRYQIRIRGHLTPRWQGWFENVTITLEDNGNTVLTCSVADQAALYGLLRKVRDIGLPLLSVIRLEPGESDPPTYR